MSVDSVADLVATLRGCRLLEPAQLQELESDLERRFSDARTLAGALVQRAWITPYQAEQLISGQGENLVLGSYVLLEPLGEGGMGQVFKARNRLGRVVALKLIHPERAPDPTAVRRFQREIHATAQLDHPNVVRAFDAGQVNGTPFIAVEYVEGTDLAQLVRQRGPLPVAEACAHARQAALGLQHAHERGLVHRDLKPSNLMLTGQGVVKVLDLGLARLFQPSATIQTMSELTQEGAVMGTPDYIAPEQALDARSADIRSDLYSLGCTLYFLLTGQPPFPGGSLTEKLLKHQMSEPRPVEQVRSGIPPKVAAVVRRLMAKRPQDRFRTPAEAACALAEASADRAPETFARTGPAPDGVAESKDRTTTFVPSPARPESTSAALPGGPALPPGPVRTRSSRWIWWLAAACVLLAAGVVGGLSLATLGFPTPAVDTRTTPSGRAEPRPQLVSSTSPLVEAEGVIVQREDGSHQVRMPHYEAVMAPDGCLTSLKIGSVELFKPGIALPGEDPPRNYSRGAYFFDEGGSRDFLRLSHIEQSGPDVLTASSDLASIRYQFGPDTMTWTLKNASDHPMRFLITFDPVVGVVRGGQDEWAPTPVEKNWATTTWFAGRSKLTIKGGTRIWGPWAGKYQVWDAVLTPGEWRNVVLTPGSATAPEADKVAALTGAKVFTRERGK